MTKKSNQIINIGIIQISIGILLIVGGIWGFICEKQVQENYQEEIASFEKNLEETSKNYNSSSDIEKIDQKISMYSNMNSLFLEKEFKATKIYLASVFAIIISLLFITEGLFKIKRW